jgi:hypothetical protein
MLWADFSVAEGAVETERWTEKTKPREHHSHPSWHSIPWAECSHTRIPEQNWPDMQSKNNNGHETKLCAKSRPTLCEGRF